jgi:Amt family ammonium transporter
LLGPRSGRFYDVQGEKLEEPKHFPGHSKTLQMLGTFILWFGWFGFNAGSAISLESGYNPYIVSLAVVNTTLSGSVSGIVALFTNLVISERLTGEPHYNLSYAMNGCLAGLAAITGSCGIVEPWAACVIGFVSGWLFLLGSKLLQKLCLDDAVDAIPVHFVGGSWGMIAVGLFASPSALKKYLGLESVSDVKHVGWFYSLSRGSSDATLLGCQIIGLLFIMGWVLVTMYPFFVALNYCGILRADSLEEVVGLDVSYHGWTPAVVDDVTQSDLDRYLVAAKAKNRLSRHGGNDRHDEEEDNNGVDRFE